MSEEAIRDEYLKHRQAAIENRVAFSDALEKVSTIGELTDALRRFSFLSDDLGIGEAQLMIPGHAETLPEARGVDEFGFKKDNYGISTQHPLEDTLNLIEEYSRGEIAEQELYETLGFNNPALKVLERIIGISFD